jgi:hypothetical protein
MSQADSSRRSDDGKPNPVINALSNAVAALRADDDQLELAKAHKNSAPRPSRSSRCPRRASSRPRPLQ